MSESYQGFNIEIERTDRNSLYLWAVVGTDGHVYGCGQIKQDTGEDYWEATETAYQFIDSYLHSLPETEDRRAALKTQLFLKDLEERLEQLTDADYSNYHKRIVAGGFNNTGNLLDHAREVIKEAMKINERVMRAMKAFPGEELEAAIQQYIQSNYG